ncbi:unnamed protein product [Paramecium octaurelia]|uniref:Uncharacterized protein n=1 Tax=Paramecium octaurelia TaxID=43137 RepID=A0A8S1YLB1_PAROT|nr:unnamed protein product [Paramecium octaurelia]
MSENLKSMFFQLFQQESYFPQYNPVKQIIFGISTSFRILAIIIQCLCDNASSTVLEELQQLHVNHTEQLSQIPPLFYVSMSFSKNQFIQFQIHLVWITFHMLDVIINLRPQRFELDKEIQKEQNIEDIQQQYQSNNVQIFSLNLQDKRDSYYCQNHSHQDVLNLQFLQFFRHLKQEPEFGEQGFQSPLQRLYKPLNFLLLRNNLSGKTNIQEYCLTSILRKLYWTICSQKNYMLKLSPFCCCQYNIARNYHKELALFLQARQIKVQVGHALSNIANNTIIHKDNQFIDINS